MKNYKHLKDGDYRLTNWSGGTTKELFIFPNDAVFKDNTFQVRLSIATVEVDKSTFTKLPGVCRTLMVLDGQLNLEHQGHHSCTLAPYEQDTFEGDWLTLSTGKVTDFNVMTKGKTKSTIQNVSLISGEKLALTSAYDLQFLYVHKGVIEINGTEITAGDSLVIENVNYVKLLSKNSSEVILVSIDY